MRSAILAGLMAATMIPTMAQAQNAELRHDRRDVRDEQRDVARDYRNGASMHRIREDRRDVREARREYREDWRDYRSRHPDYYRGPAWVGPRRPSTTAAIGSTLIAITCALWPDMSAGSAMAATWC